MAGKCVQRDMQLDLPESGVPDEARKIARKTQFAIYFHPVFGRDGNHTLLQLC